MQVYKYCHCLLFVTPAGLLPITEYLPHNHPGRGRRARTGKTNEIIISEAHNVQNFSSHNGSGVGARA